VSILGFCVYNFYVRAGHVRSRPGC